MKIGSYHVDEYWINQHHLRVLRLSLGSFLFKKNETFAGLMLFHVPRSCVWYVLFIYFSLYPHCNKKALCPIRHPVVIWKQFWTKLEQFLNRETLILPPGDLKLPDLSFRSKKGLLFTLCATFAKIRRNRKCICATAKRTLAATWCTLKVNNCVWIRQRVHFCSSIPCPT